MVVRILAAVAVLVVASGCNIFLGTTEPPRTFTVTVDPEKISLTVGGSPATATATVAELRGVISIVDNGSSVEWQTSNPNVATVTQGNRTTTVTAVNPGSATITAKSSKGVSGSAAVVVAPKT
jgi:uncharacterized protein YjdB